MTTYYVEFSGIDPIVFDASNMIVALCKANAYAAMFATRVTLVKEATDEEIAKGTRVHV